MSDQRSEGMAADETGCKSTNDTSQGLPSPPPCVNESEHLQEGSNDIDVMSVSGNAVSSDGAAASIPSEVNSKPNSSSSSDNINNEKCAVTSAAGAHVPEAGGAMAAACGISDGFSGCDLDAMIARQRELVSQMKAERQQFVRRIELAEAEIQNAAERMYGAVDNRVNELLASAGELRSERASQLEQARSQIQSRLTAMNYHHQFAEQLLKHGTPADITHYAPLLHEDAERICNEPLPEIPPMTFESEAKLAALQAFAGLNVEDMRQEIGENLVGHITRTEVVDASPLDGISPYLGQPRLIASTDMNNGVCGVAFVDVRLIVVRERSSVVGVYMTSEGLVLVKEISVEQMTCPTSIAASSSACCVFISDAQVLNFVTVLFYSPKNLF